MGFTYEKLGEENEELWKKIGFKDWFLKPIFFSRIRKWVIDRENEIYLYFVGSFRFGETPFYCDLCYKERIIRMEVFFYGKETVGGYEGHCRIEKMYIPKSIWKEKDKIVEIALEMVKICHMGGKKFKSEDSMLKNEPECVEKDYNGK